ncbi:hypothetical protein DFQ27_002315 [Actinomortierella ambigua]|uniref:ORC6 first cyclin-like domain-containing protein n=1 Tax=Actinomortierella ambigua TaxID=1343610 RepID=A0A9P6Q7Z8_9FUNG|nr:hypothetical protein DFQ27_002315 [Actinomortierella ambigua]
MSRRDIITLLERLSLDHRASLAEKACSYLLSVESNRAIKSHPSHAAICVDIAAEQLDIEVSRQALVRMSGAPSPVAYNSTLQIIRRQLLGDRASSTAVAASPNSATTAFSSPSSSSSTATFHHTTSSTDYGASGGGGGTSSAHQAIVELITMDNFSILRQLSIKRGSMELDRLVLECLSQFFDKWVAALTPAQRAHVDYADLKWVGAAFWLCSLARQRQVKAPESVSSAAVAVAVSTTATEDPTASIQQQDGDKQKAAPPVAATAAAAAPKRLGGKGAKELKEMVLDMLQHRVTTKEFDKTIKLMEDTVSDYLLSLGVQKRPASGGAKKATGTRTATATGGRKRKATDQESEGGSTPASAASSDTEASKTSTVSAAKMSAKSPSPISSSYDTAATTPIRRAGIGAAAIATKRTISNVSDISLEGGMTAALERESEDSTMATTARVEVVLSTPSSSALPPTAKRARMEGGGRVTKSRATSSSSSVTKASSAPSATTERRTGNVFTMIPRVKYQQTKAYQHYVEWRKQILKRLGCT